MRSFNIDINSTKNCNLRCKYCFEAVDSHKTLKNFEDPDGFIKFMDKFMTTDYFKSKFSHTVISFWGGEPTLNKDLFIKVTSKYMNDTKVRYMMYTNGYQIPDEMMSIFTSMNGMMVCNNPKIVVQISYDGMPIHDNGRVNIKGYGSSEKVRESIQKIKDRGVFLTLKSTVSPDDFRYLYEAYLDVISLSTNFGYFPSIDLRRDYVDDEYKEFGEDIYKSLIKIAAHEIKNGTSSFKWFQDKRGGGRALCSAGSDMVAVDTNGDIVPCHGALYMNTDDHMISNIRDQDAVEKVINTMEWFKTFYNKEPDKCKKCKNIFCLRCNAVKFSVSKKTLYQERWTDYDAQDYLCYFFDIVDVVYRAKKGV